MGDKESGRMETFSDQEKVYLLLELLSKRFHALLAVEIVFNLKFWDKTGKYLEGFVYIFFKY